MEEKNYSSVDDLDAAYFGNLAKDLSEKECERIAHEVVTGYEKDKGTISGLVEFRKQYKAFTDLKHERKEGVGAKLNLPVIKTATSNFSARANANLFTNDSKIVKMQSDLVNELAEEGEAYISKLEKSFNMDLFTMPNFFESFRKTLTMLPEDGYAFRRVYWDSSKKRVMSELCNPDDIVLSYGTKDLLTCPRITYIKRLNHIDILERMGTKDNPGVYKFYEDLEKEDSIEDSPESDVIQSSMESKGIQKSEAVDYTSPQNVLEQYTYLSLKEGGRRSWYVASVHESSGKLLSLNRCSIPVDGREERLNYFVCYQFLDRGDTIFGDGFGYMLLSPQSAINSVANQILDAASFSNFRGGFVTKGSGISRGTLKFNHGEWKEVDVPRNKNIKDSIMNLDFPPPSGVSLSLLEFLQTNYVDRLTTVTEISTGGTPRSDTTATAAQLAVEQSAKVFTEIQKSIHRTFRKELEIMYTLNSIHLENNEMKNLYRMTGIDVSILPVSDPNIVSPQQQVAKAEALKAAIQNDPVLAMDKEANKLAMSKLIEATQGHEVHEEMMKIYDNGIQTQSEAEQMAQALQQENEALKQQLQQQDELLDESMKTLETVDKDIQLQES